MKTIIKKKYLFFIFLFFPYQIFGFSETELDSLENTGKKSFSERSFRTQMGFALQRNLEVNSRINDLFNINKDTSLLDLSNLYYILSLNLNYSLGTWAKNYGYPFLKDIELFVSGSFRSPFKGYKNYLKSYTFMDYFQYALGDIISGFSIPTYNQGSFLSYFSLSFLAFPSSRFSKEAGLLTTVSGTMTLLYFLKRGKKWNLLFSSNHDLSHSQYNKPATDSKGKNYNIPFDMGNSGSFIYKQSYNKFIPSNISLSLSHYFGINTKWTQNHDLTLSVSSSWKLKDRLYMNFSVRWKDRVYLYNPYNEKVQKKEPIRFNLTHTFFTLGGSYSF